MHLQNKFLSIFLMMAMFSVIGLGMWINSSSLSVSPLTTPNPVITRAPSIVNQFGSSPAPTSASTLLTSPSPKSTTNPQDRPTSTQGASPASVTVTGIATDSNSSPLNNVRVYITDTVSTVTKVDGTFTITDPLAGGLYRVYAHHLDTGIVYTLKNDASIRINDNGATHLQLVFYPKDI